MALVIKHLKVSAIPDGSDPSLVLPSDWNADHSLAGVADLAQGGTGATTAATARTNLGLGSVATENIVPVAKGGTGQATAIAALNALLPAQTGQAAKVLTTDGTNATWQASGGGTLIGTTQSATPFETSLGVDAGLSNTGVNNTYLGYFAGRLMTGATNNVVIGYQAMDNATIPASCVIIGASAGGAYTGASTSVVIGHLAGGTATSNGGDCVYIGSSAGSACTGGGNILIGSLAGNAATNAGSLVGIGTGVFSTTTSAANGAVAVGHNALGSLTTGAGNTAVGYLVGDAITTGANNTLVGDNAGGAGINMSDCTFIGKSAGILCTASNNTAIGSGAGSTLFGGVGNTFLGKGSGSAVTSGSNNTLIGGYAGTASSTNSVVLSDGAGNIRQMFNLGGAMSFDGTNFGGASAVLQSNGPDNRPSWVNPNVGAVAQFATNVNMLPNISVYFINCSAGNIIATLPSASVNVGLQIKVKRVDTVAGNTLTIASAGGQVEGGATQDIGVSVAVQYCSDGTNWWELANG